MKRATIACTVLFILQGCAPKVKIQLVKNYPVSERGTEIVVFELGENYPDDAEEIGTVKVTDTGFTLRCTYEIVLENAKSQARKAGGNAIVVTEHKTPSALGSTCHRIEAKIIKISNPQQFARDEDNTIEDKSVALLHLYRFGGMGSLVGYNLYLGDSLICRVKNKWKETVALKKAGQYSLWAKTESKTEIPISVELGREYYVQCGVSMGAMVGRPTLSFTRTEIGRMEYNSIKDK